MAVSSRVRCNGKGGAKNMGQERKRQDVTVSKRVRCDGKGGVEKMGYESVKMIIP